ncbi:extensin family protein [Pseudomonas typographi]|uniref:Extensin family protein n=1 Tax=Pseudomonas typographi TaxID=2715964 RepID=A0ABR7Z829_9PSED|nr:extensin family protein [Pseudomonas typographi]MBD1553702.1 extensin family protein [Pseudomonas typographi]MBD1589062.1 extensin family protein [Pseudomonas typographi]MBD1601423.1 extensin family protein [Pseudomonas typographi]
MKSLTCVLILVASLGAAFWRGWLQWPPRWNPWAPLDVREAPNLLARFKLARLAENPMLCRQALASAGLRFTDLADSQVGQCPLHNVVRVLQAGVRFNHPFLATCPLAVGFALFERHTLQPAAQAVFGQPVVAVEHLGSFACRNVYNRPQGRRSEHATANALDITALRLADGRRISVLQGWAAGGAESAFLRQVRDGACQAFNGVLGPDYNAAHRGHFHLDMGRWAACR